MYGKNLTEYMKNHGESFFFSWRINFQTIFMLNIKKVKIFKALRTLQEKCTNYRRPENFQQRSIIFLDNSSTAQILATIKCNYLGG